MGNLRYYALGAYTGLVALFTITDKISFDDPTTAIALLAPIALLVGADVIKHRSN
jgi:hypothetical protein